MSTEYGNASLIDDDNSIPENLRNRLPILQPRERVKIEEVTHEHIKRFIPFSVPPSAASLDGDFRRKLDDEEYAIQEHELATKICASLTNR